MTLNSRMTVTTAVACVLVSTVLLPLFTDTLWFVIGAGAVIAVAGTGALTRLRTLPVSVCLAAGLVGLLLYLNLIFEVRHSLLLVIPTPGSLSRLWHLAGTGLHDANRYAPPAPNRPGLLLLAVGGVGITAVLTDLIAVRLRSTALAGLPLLVLFTVPVTMNAPHSALTTGLVFCLSGVGYLAMLSADGRERIRVWGRLVSLWRSAPRYGRAPAAPSTGTARNERGLAGAGKVRPGHPGAGRGGPPGRARLHRAGLVRAADRARPAREQAVLLRPRHRRHGRWQRPVPDAAERPEPGRRAAAREPAAHPVHVLDQRHPVPAGQRRGVLQAVRLRHAGRQGLEGRRLGRPFGTGQLDPRSPRTERPHGASDDTDDRAGRQGPPQPGHAADVPAAALPGHPGHRAGQVARRSRPDGVLHQRFHRRPDVLGDQRGGGPEPGPAADGTGPGAYARAGPGPAAAPGVPDVRPEEARGQQHGRPDHRVRQGERASHLAVGPAVHVQPRPGAADQRTKPGELPDQGQERLLRAVRVRDDRADPPARHPGPVHRRLHGRDPAEGRQLRGQDHGLARLDRGVLPEHGLDQVRAHAGRPGHRQRPRLHDRRGADRAGRRLRPGHLARPRSRVPSRRLRPLAGWAPRPSGRTTPRAGWPARPSGPARRGRRSRWP